MSEENIKPINVDEEVKSSFLDYSMSVIISRALPDARDGLKPSQRRLLFAMGELGVLPNRKHLKCAKIVGETMGNYHPHGDQAIYPTLVNMAQPWGIREQLVDGQGNFGSVEGDPPAAMRYTEARLTHLGNAMMADLDMETVDWVKNYDETRDEPVVLPAAFPNLLVNGGTGIAVGMATNMPPHNLREVVDGICAQVDNPQITIAELMHYIKGPDFPTGCTILGTSGVREYMETGHGSFRIRGHAEVVEHGNREQIIITAIPYGVNRALLCERIGELASEKILPEITGVRDESDENTRVVIDLKRDARAQVVLNNLYKHTSLETSFSVNMLAIDNRRPKLLSVKDAINCYIEHRREIIIRRTRYLLRKAEDSAEKLEALLLAIGNLDEFIKMIRDSSSKDEAASRIKAMTFTVEAAQAFGILIRGQASVKDGQYILTDRQVDHILELRLYQLTALERNKLKDEYDALLSTITDLLDILAKEQRVLTIIKDELRAVALKWGNDRLTQFGALEGEIQSIDLIPNDPAVVTMTHFGSIKRTNTREFTLQGRGGKGLRGMETRQAADEVDKTDFVEHVFSAHLHDFLLFFTNTGRMFVERVHAIPEMARTGKGRSIKNLLDLRPDEKIAAVLTLQAVGAEDDAMWAPDKYVLFGTKDGTVKKTALEEYKNYRKGGIIALKIEEGNELIDVVLTDGSNQICLVTREGMCVRCEETDIRSMGRAATGVAGIRPAEGDYVVSLTVVDMTAQLLVVSEKGLGKRTPFEEYRLTTRGAKGVTTMNVTDKTGAVVTAMAVHDTDELMLMTSKGQSVRIKVGGEKGIRETGRNAQGVKLMNLNEGETIQDVAKVMTDAEEEGENGGEGGAATAAADSPVDEAPTDAPQAQDESEPPASEDSE
ncbi:DNA gyrase subunit A [Roseimicrobium sp. ORNL1]|uniref:DNA gyrase subunit A n=1 Tax=Roseimicrobium sp. ORNL1 TaxID=2711231 RepID=UPI0013E139A9|nr:DNA gyrase subunit A [Roseimicrobium sp. ORNL1]QIF03189.1 DNA gyrase subunit A [Roseimicrobium sp. ORNL1]